MNYSAVGPNTAMMIQLRIDIDLYLTTAVMIMGLNLPNIYLVFMVRPFSMLHSLVQACGRGGRKTLTNERRKVVFFLLYNNNDVAENIDVSAAVREFCNTQMCLKKFLRKYFGVAGFSDVEWCCSLC